MNIFVVILGLILLLMICVIIYGWMEKKRVFAKKIFLAGRMVTDQHMLTMTEEEISRLSPPDRDWLLNYAAHHSGEEWVRLFEKVSRCKYPHRINLQ